MPAYIGHLTVRDTVGTSPVSIVSLWVRPGDRTSFTAVRVAGVR
ncbi:MAG: hypothetical protein ACI30J_04005 [Paludibacteraceae bacterium]